METININLNLFGVTSENDALDELNLEQRLREVLRMNKPSHRHQPVELRKALARLPEERAWKTMKNYETAINSIYEFAGHKLTTDELTLQLVNDYEQWLKERHVNYNTISCYMRSLRAVYNKITGLNTTADGHPFGEAYTGHPVTEKRSITADELKRMHDLKLPPGSNEALYRDIFLFQFYALGMPFIDVAHLRHSQIRDEVLTYYRKKTGLPVKVFVEPCMSDIIRRHIRPCSDLVFPILESRPGHVITQLYQSRLTAYNVGLKDLARRAGINANITSYTPRHTWASLAFACNVDLPVISKALGHHDTTTTLIYIRELNDDRIFKANQKMLREVFGYRKR